MTIPVDLAMAQRQLRQGGETLDDDRTAEITGFIARAAGWVERYTGCILAARDVTERFFGFDRIRLRAWPVKPGAVPVVSYADAASPAIGVAAVRICAATRPARVVPSIGSVWPSVPIGTAVTVTVRAGYEPEDAVPEDFTTAMLVLIAAYDADREGGDLFAKAEFAARSLCREYRLQHV